jgi:aryl-alcohol dehydrogenase-like predicted oxidoreductase
MGVIVWSPLNDGWLSGSRKRSADATGVVTRRSKLMPQLFDLVDDGEAYKFDLLEELGALAGSIGMPLRQMALA